MSTTFKRNARNMAATSAVFIGMFLSPALPAADFPAPGDFNRGAKAWSENCARCHNMRDPKDLRDDQWVTTMFHMRVRAGLTGQETRDILTFLQASNDRPLESASLVKTSAGKPSRVLDGKTVYETNCSSCHGTNGKGAFPGVPDFNRSEGRLSKTDQQLLQSISNGIQSPGSAMAMPPKGGNAELTDQDIKAVLVYIREVFGK